MTPGSPSFFSSLPPSLLTGMGATVARFSLAATLLDLDLLSGLIDQGGEEPLCREWLHPSERERLSSLRQRKRHLEWLGGRLCVKEAVRLFLHDGRPHPQEVAPSRFQIVSMPSGRPVLAPDAFPGNMALPSLSISHSGKYAMAVAAAVPCGIDIQQPRDALIRVKERYCGPAEEDVLARTLAGLELRERLLLLWAAKESIKKAGVHDRMPGFLELVLCRVESVFPAPSRSSVFRLSFDYCEEVPGTSGAKAAPSACFQSLVCLHQDYGIGLCAGPGFRPGICHA